MKIRFVKMHGCGNDYVYIDAINQPGVAAMIEGEAWPELVRRMSDRHTGIGSDGVIAICSPTADAARRGAKVRMRMFNADASEGEMCGNGVRCVAKFAHDRMGAGGRDMPMKVETGRGVLSIEYRVEGGKVVEARVDMGEPILEPAQVPIDVKALDKAKRNGEHAIDMGFGPLCFVSVSMGNPHAVFFDPRPPKSEYSVDTVYARFALNFEEIAPAIEGHEAFPNQINVHAVSNIHRDSARMRTWERGSGLTLACGTGACAVLVAGVLTERMDRKATISVPGGALVIEWEKQSNHVFMTGPATDVFEGEWVVE